MPSSRASDGARSNKESVRATAIPVETDAIARASRKVSGPVGCIRMGRPSAPCTKRSDPNGIRASMAATDRPIDSRAEVSAAGIPDHDSGDLGGPANVRPMLMGGMVPQSGLGGAAPIGACATRCRTRSIGRPYVSATVHCARAVYDPESRLRRRPRAAARGRGSRLATDPVAPELSVRGPRVGSVGRWLEDGLSLYAVVPWQLW